MDSQLANLAALIRRKDSEIAALKTTVEAQLSERNALLSHVAMLQQRHHQLEQQHHQQQQHDQLQKEQAQHQQQQQHVVHKQQQYGGANPPPPAALSHHASAEHRDLQGEATSGGAWQCRQRRRRTFESTQKLDILKHYDNAHREQSHPSPKCKSDSGAPIDPGREHYDHPSKAASVCNTITSSRDCHSETRQPVSAQSNYSQLGCIRLVARSNHRRGPRRGLWV